MTFLVCVTFHGKQNFDKFTVMYNQEPWYNRLVSKLSVVVLRSFLNLDLRVKNILNVSINDVF